MNKIFIFIVTVFIFNSCQIYQKVNLPPQNGITGYSGNDENIKSEIATSNQRKLEIYEAEKQFYSNREELNWGLALSGGGIRSALVNIGALKALYDLEILDSIQIMSSVSGGGYALGWFYSNEIYNNSQKLGTSLLDNESFLKHICKLQNKAKMMRVPTMINTLFLSPNRAFNKYEKGIQGTFINDSAKNLKLNSFLPYMNGQKPYFIINSTIQTKKNNDWLSSLYENTPFYKGNPEIGYQKTNDTNSITLEKAITISGAALKFKLLNKTPNHSNKIESKYIPLSDGGHSENLGAISLIRRGVKNIIIIDAEHNKNLSFDGYKILKQQLRDELSLDFSIPLIDSFIESNGDILSKSVFKGTVKSIYINPDFVKEPVEINVFYVKMSLPKTVNLKLDNNSLFEKGRSIHLKNEKISCIEYSKKGNCSKYNCNISKLTIEQKNDFYPLSIYWVKSYSEWLNEKSKWKFVNYKFPHTTTADQSFYRDQLSAFIGLGYLQTMELKNVISKK